MTPGAFKQQPNAEREPYELALEAAFGELETARRQQTNEAEVGASILSDLVAKLLAVLPAERRAPYVVRLNKVPPVSRPQPRDGTVYDNVVRLLLRRPDEEWSAGKVRDELVGDGVQPEQKTIYNALNYLAKTGRL